MEYCPDAPYIREAERCGMPSPDPVYCPICGFPCEYIYEDKDGEACGCDRCVRSRDAFDWQEENRDE